jgi:lysophospholipase L1-like esterase
MVLPWKTVTGGVVDSMNVLDVSACVNWDTFKNKMAHVRTDSSITVSMLFIGDSHLQGGYSTNVIRELLKNDGLHAGRGSSFPYSIAKTNGPEDYVIKSNADWVYSRWGQVISIPLAGYVVSTDDTDFTMTIYNKKTFPSYPFKSLTFYHSSDSISLSSDTPFDSVIHTKKTDCLVESSIYFSQRTDSCTLNFTIHTTAQEFSLFLIKQKDTLENVTVNVLGMNGISYKHYNNKVDLTLLPVINPDLMVIALGTNDIFSRYADTMDLRSNITGLITKIRQLLPETALLLSTPNDHLVKKRYKNRVLPLACGIIKNVAKKERCGIWDFYTIMGGDSSVRNWRKKELMHTDYVHLTKRGYAYQGELFYKALRKAISDSLSNNPSTDDSLPVQVRTGSDQQIIDSGNTVPEQVE